MREDGQRLFHGALPSLIQWGKPDAAMLQAAYDAIGLAGITLRNTLTNEQY